MTEHEVRTVYEMGWAGTKNGDLLRLAQQNFHVFLTVDRNLSFQQNLPQFDIAVVILHAMSNRLHDLQQLIPNLERTLSEVTKGQVHSVRL